MEKIFILDTSVIIDNPECFDILRNGEENEIRIPYSVILELDGLKRKPDLRYVISEVATRMERDDNIQIFKGNGKPYSDSITGDERIFNDIRLHVDSLTEKDRERTYVVSNDKFFRIRMRTEGYAVQEFKSSHPFVSESQMYTGFHEGETTPILNSFTWEEGKPRFHGTESRIVDHENRPWGLSPRNVYQNLAVELMLEPNIDIVTIQSQAGYGKTYLALACAMEQILGKPRLFNKLYIVKPNIEIGEKIGFLPGEVEEKLEPFYKPILNLIMKLHELRPANRFFINTETTNPKLNPNKCEILPLNYVRGMNLENCVVIIDEAQNLTRLQTRTLLTRMGHNVKCYMLGDTDQVDHPYLNQFNNGLTWVVKKFKGYGNYGHIVLKGSKSRGPITDMVLKSEL